MIIFCEFKWGKGTWSPTHAINGVQTPDQTNTTRVHHHDVQRASGMPGQESISGCRFWMFTHSKPPWYTPISWCLSPPTTAGCVSLGGRLTVCVKAVPGLPPCPPGTGSSRICPRPGQHYRIYWSSACRPRSPPLCGLCSLCNRQHNFIVTYPLRNKNVSLI